MKDKEGRDVLNVEPARGCVHKMRSNIPPPLEKKSIQSSPIPYCLTGKQWPTKQGDTWESVTKGNSISAVGVYMDNQDLTKDCANVTPGVSVCIPMACITYDIQPTGTCCTIGSSQRLASGIVLQYNSWLDAGRTNLKSVTRFHGNISAHLS